MPFSILSRSQVFRRLFHEDVQGGTPCLSLDAHSFSLRHYWLCRLEPKPKPHLHRRPSFSARVPILRPANRIEVPIYIEHAFDGTLIHDSPDGYGKPQRTPMLSLEGDRFYVIAGGRSGLGLSRSICDPYMVVSYAANPTDRRKRQTKKPYQDPYASVDFRNREDRLAISCTCEQQCYRRERWEANRSSDSES
jgi:hypothetical protein